MFFHVQRRHITLILSLVLPLFGTLLGRGVVLGEAAAAQAAIMVTTGADVVADDGQCSLREAVTAANLDASSGTLSGECAAGNGADTILLPARVYLLAIAGADEDNNGSGDLDVTTSISLQGEGAATTIIDGGGLDRVLHLLPGGEASLQDVTVTGGAVSDANGGGVYNTGRLLLSGSVITNNVAGGAFPNGRGGGLWSNTIVTVTASVIGNNDAERDGGGIFNGGALWLRQATLTGNAGLIGGGLNNDLGATAVLISTTVQQNHAALNGGGASNRGSFTVNAGTIFRANRADLNGGGVYNSNSGMVTLTGTSLDANQANLGGGLYSRDADLTIIATLFSGNQAGEGGGLYARDGSATIANTTFSGNQATAAGGGIYHHGVHVETAVDLAYVTFADNSAAAGRSLYNQSDGPATGMTLSALLLSGGSHCAGNGTIASSGYNIADDASCPLNDVTDLVDASLTLLPLADNGGPSRTHAPAAGSPALDFIPAGANGCGTIWTADQRGVARPQNDACDAGAFEQEEVPIYTLYLPLTLRDYLVAPDLIIQDIVVTATDVQITIENIGTGAVTGAFWVDLYVNPDPPPTMVNETWEQLATEGLVWGVLDVTPLTPGGTIVLDLAHPSYAPDLSHFSGTFMDGMEIYVQVDSANTVRDTGGVEESHEILGEPYNNISHETVTLP